MSSGPIPYPTNAGEDPQRAPQGRERGPWETPADPSQRAMRQPRTRYRALSREL